MTVAGATIEVLRIRDVLGAGVRKVENQRPAGRPGHFSGDCFEPAVGCRNRPRADGRTDAKASLMVGVSRFATLDRDEVQRGVRERAPRVVDDLAFDAAPARVAR